MYQQYRTPVHGSASSDVFSYNTRSGKRQIIGAPVSTDEWEYWPEASGSTILFGRCRTNNEGQCLNGSQRLLLYRPDVSHRVQTLARYKNSSAIAPGFVGNRYVAWTKCHNSCVVRYYDMDLKEFHTVSTSGHDFYGPVIDETAKVLYFVQGHSMACGVNVTIRRMDLDSANSRPVLSLPAGVDSGWKMSLAPATHGHMDLYFAREPSSRNCKHVTSDIYAIRDVDTR